MHFETRAIRVGQEPDPATGAIIPPIYATSNFQRHSIDQQEGYSYSRVSNPTRAAAEQCLAALENARYGLLFAFGNMGENLPEDANGDGTVDDADLLTVLFNFGAGC